jgi:hypothetical protein
MSDTSDSQPWLFRRRSDGKSASVTTVSVLRSPTSTGRFASFATLDGVNRGSWVRRRSRTS